MSFGTKLKLCRSALGLSQQQLADLVGSTKQIVSLYEKDERIPKVTTAAKYADAVKVPLKYLITDSIPINLWEADDLLEDYWRASPADRLKIVVHRGIDPRIALDYERVSALAQLAKTEKNRRPGRRRSFPSGCQADRAAALSDRGSEASAAGPDRDSIKPTRMRIFSSSVSSWNLSSILSSKLISLPFTSGFLLPSVFIMLPA